MNYIDPSIDDFYAQSAEESRLKMGLGPLEFERNKDLISRYLPSSNGVIADIGGGTGHYSQWLANLGHQVFLIDPVIKHIHQAEKRSNKSKHPFKAILGEARQLPLADHCADVVILHGPLYHLQDEAERIAAIKEARRILRIGGIVLGFAITYSAFTLAALQNGMIHNPDVFSMCKEELSSSYHHPPGSIPGMLAQAYFHRPSALISEFESVGFKTVDLLAVEGIAWIDSKYFESWSSTEQRLRLLELVKLTEKDTELLCLSPHIMLAAEIELF
jgi:ubiquinone/menaquinone biosynthesis C-methylase UbiE